MKTEYIDLTDNWTTVTDGVQIFDVKIEVGSALFCLSDAETRRPLTLASGFTRFWPGRKRFHFTVSASSQQEVLQQLSAAVSLMIKEGVPIRESGVSLSAENA